MSRFRLGDADRQRLGCPEILEFDPDKMMINDLIELPEATGYTVASLQEALRRNADPDTDRDWRASKAMVWLALRHAGIHVGFDELDFDVAAFRLADDEAPAGKDQPADVAASTSTGT